MNVPVDVPVDAPMDARLMKGNGSSAVWPRKEKSDWLIEVG